MKILKVFDAAAKMKEAYHDATEEEKKGRYRAGSTGLYKDGVLYGKCARKLFLRSKGMKEGPVPLDRRNMFAGGLMNEEVVVEDLKLGADHFNILREEEIPTSWNTETSDTAVTGRPDVVFQDPKTKELILGLELKMMASVWTAKSIAQGKPKTYHVLQAAHYMWQLGIPFKIVYKSYVDFHCPNYGLYFPRNGEKGSEYIEYKQVSKKKKEKVWNEEKQMMLESTVVSKVDQAFKVLPFTKVFDIKFNESGVLLIKEEEEVAYQITEITIDGIKEYFEELDRTLSREELPARPKNIDIFGKKENWKDCDYCPLKPVCDASEDSVSGWLKAVETFNRTSMIVHEEK